ncbi:MAG: hypothetical protein GY782_08070 [Gammaproteobacteria bacterium]|nr:hypothetical protein [Gammaproteobacteria bacterium]
MKHASKRTLILTGLALAFTSLLSGCVIGSTVTKMSNGDYRLTATSDNPQRSRFGATNQAERFCNKQHASYKFVRMYTVDDNFGKKLATISAIENGTSQTNVSTSAASINKNPSYTTTLIFKCHQH